MEKRQGRLLNTPDDMRVGIIGHEACYDCVYSGMAGAHLCCLYWDIANQLRPCPGGEGCTVKIVGDRHISYKRKMSVMTKRRSPMRSRKWDTELARKMLEEGATVAATAEAVGISVNSLDYWRRSEGMVKPRKSAQVEDMPQVEAASESLVESYFSANNEPEQAEELRPELEPAADDKPEPSKQLHEAGCIKFDLAIGPCCIHISAPNKKMAEALVSTAFDLLAALEVEA